MNYATINLMAHSSKLAVESTSLNRYAKEGIKLDIDFASDMAKRTQPFQQQNFSVMGLSLENVQAIKTVARANGLERVILYPCVVNGRWTACLGMSGGNVDGFCKGIGIALLEKSSINSTPTEQDSLFREYGITLFLRSDEE